MSEQLVIIEEISELVVVEPAAEQFVIREQPTLQLLEVVERGPEGPANYDAEVLAWLNV